MIGTFDRPLVEQFWQRCLDYTDIDTKKRRRRPSTRKAESGMTVPPEPPEVCFYPGSNALECDRLNDRLMTGECTLLLTSVDELTQEERGIPLPDSLRITLNSRGIPCCVIRSLETRLIPYRGIGEKEVQAEGLYSDLSVWRQKVGGRLIAAAKESGQVFSLDTLILADRVKVEYWEKVEPDDTGSDE